MSFPSLLLVVQMTDAGVLIRPSHQPIRHILPERLVVTRDLTRTRHEDGDELARMRVEHEDDSRAREDMDLATGAVPGVHEALADDVAETHRLGDAHNALMAVAVEVPALAETAKLTAERVEVPADLALDDVEVAAHGVSFPLCRYHHSKLPTHKYGKVGTYIYRTQPFSWTRGNDSPMPRKRGHPVGAPLHRPARRFRMTCRGTGRMPRREKPHVR